MESQDWHDLGEIEALRQKPLQEIVIGKTRLAVSWLEGKLAVISGACNHVSGPLGQGTLEGDYVVCLWH